MTSLRREKNGRHTRVIATPPPRAAAAWLRDCLRLGLMRCPRAGSARPTTPPRFPPSRMAAVEERHRRQQARAPRDCRHGIAFRAGSSPRASFDGRRRNEATGNARHQAVIDRQPMRDEISNERDDIYRSSKNTAGGSIIYESGWSMLDNTATMSLNSSMPSTARQLAGLLPSAHTPGPSNI